MYYNTTHNAVADNSIGIQPEPIIAVSVFTLSAEKTQEDRQYLSIHDLIVRSNLIKIGATMKNMFTLIKIESLL